MTIDPTTPGQAAASPGQGLDGGAAAPGSGASMNRRELVSQDEMDALMQGLGAADAELDAVHADADATADHGGNPRIETLDVARLPHLTLSSLPGLDAIHERLARWLVGRLYEAVGAEVQVVPMPLQLQRYGDLALASADDAQGSLLNVAGLPGQGFLLMENLLVQAWIDLLYGGGSNAPPLAQDGRKPPIAKISAIGLRAVSRLVQHLVAGYTQVWASMHATPISRPARMAGLVAADARVFVCSFQISLGTIQTGFQIWLPHAMLEPMLAIWRQPSGEPSARYHADWHQRLTQSLQSVRVQLQARWRQPDTPLKMLAALQPGDLISLKGMPQIDDAASGNVLFAGTLQPGSPVLQMRLHGRAPAHSFHLDRAAQSGGTP